MPLSFIFILCFIAVHLWFPEPFYYYSAFFSMPLEIFLSLTNFSSHYLLFSLLKMLLSGFPHIHYVPSPVLHTAGGSIFLNCRNDPIVPCKRHLVVPTDNEIVLDIFHTPPEPPYSTLLCNLGIRLYGLSQWVLCHLVSVDFCFVQ